MNRPTQPDPTDCPDCAPVSRRQFMATTAAGVAAASSPWVLSPTSGVAHAAEKAATLGEPEKLVAALYKSLTDEQRKLVAFKYDDPLRHEIENNWFITKARVAKNFNKDQQEMIRAIFDGLHSDEYRDKVKHQVEHDNRGGIDSCSIAIFGEPGSGKSEFVFTGRHVTRRCDADNRPDTAFGGPIFYGHAAQGFNEKPDHPGNVYWFQGLRANEVFRALDGKQRNLALLSSRAPEDGPNTVKLKGTDKELPGVPMTELSGDQKDLVRKVLADLLMPFRKRDADEALKLVNKQFEQLHLSFYKNMDIGNDGVWDVWQIEGPKMVWYFRGSPHVHTWVHVKG